MDLGIKGKRALVTGGSRGIGASVARALAEEGTRVAVVSRDAESVKTLIEKIGGERSGHHGHVGDLIEEGACPALVSDLEKNFGQVDIVVQNLGGPMGVNDPLCGIEDWRQVLRFNLEITIELNGLLIPHMKAQKWGRVVHVASIAGVENTGPVPYCTAKAALCAYTRSFGRVLAPDGIVMSAVVPGVVLTEGGYWDEKSRETPEDVKSYLASRTPLGRFGTPDEVANITAFMCSQQATFMQAAIVPVDGGQAKGYFV